MAFVALLLALQAAQDPPEFEPATEPPTFWIGPIFQYWLPRFRGEIRVDGSTSGTTLNFVHELGMPDDAAIPMYGGGRIGARIDGRNSGLNLSGVAEYWTRAWKGEDVTRSSVTVGDSTFPLGTRVASRLTLTSVTLDIEGATTSRKVDFGVDLSLQITSARLRMDSTFVHASERIDTVCWGGGIFFDYKPVPFLFAGMSLKGFTSGIGDNDTGMGDFRFYGGAQWGPFRLEGGFRILLYDHDLPEESLSYTLYGAYALGSLTLRF